MSYRKRTMRRFRDSKCEARSSSHRVCQPLLANLFGLVLWFADLTTVQIGSNDNFRVCDEAGVEGLRSTLRRHSRSIPERALPPQTSSKVTYLIPVSVLGTPSQAPRRHYGQGLSRVPTTPHQGPQGHGAEVRSPSPSGAGKKRPLEQVGEQVRCTGTSSQTFRSLHPRPLK